VLVDGLADPLNPVVTTDGLVEGVNADDLEVLVGGILSHPVRVQDPEASDTAAHTFLGNALEVSLGLDLVDSVVGGLAIGGALGDLLLAATTADTDAVDQESLLGAVSQTAGLVRAGGAGSPVEFV
jgi:hypothetical protein